MKRLFTKRFFPLLIVLAALLAVLPAGAASMSIWQRSFQITGETWATEPTPGKLSYAYPGSTRTGAPGAVGVQLHYGAQISDGSSFVVTDPGDPGTTEDDVWNFTKPRDFTVQLTYVLTETEAASADLSKSTFFRMGMAGSNTNGLDISGCKVRLTFYTSENESFEVIRNWSTLTLNRTALDIDLSSYAADLEDKTLEKIVLTPFYEMTELPGGSYRHQRMFLLFDFALSDSAQTIELYRMKIIPSENVEHNTAVPDATVAVFTAPNTITTDKDALDRVSGWLAANKDELNIKLVPLMGQITTAPSSLGFAYQQIKDAKDTDHGGAYGATVATYIEQLLLDPTLELTVGSAKKTSAVFHSHLNNLASSLKTVTGAGIPVSFAYAQKDMAILQSRNHTMLDLYFRVDASDPQNSLSLDNRTTVNYDRTVIFPSGTRGTDYGVYNNSVSFATASGWSGGVQNSWYTFEADGVKYLVATVEPNPSRGVRSWLKSLSENNLDKKMIVITTGYMDKNGVLFTIWDEEAPNGILYEGVQLAIAKPAAGVEYNGVIADGTALAMKYFTTPMQAAMWASCTDGIVFWNNYLSKMPNLVLILDGGMNEGALRMYNDPSDGKFIRETQTDFSLDLVVREDTGVSGNKVTTVQANPTTLLSQMSKKEGVLLLLKFYDRNLLEISYYIPAYDAYINPEQNILLTSIKIKDACPIDAYGLKVTGVSASGAADGKITGLDPAYVYDFKASGDSGFTALPAGTTQVTGLPAGLYQIAVRGTDEYYGSAVVEYRITTEAVEVKPFWNFFPESSLTLAELRALGYDVRDQLPDEQGWQYDVVLNSFRYQEFARKYNTTYTSVSSDPEEGHWGYNSTGLPAIGYGSGMYAARNASKPNEEQHWVYRFPEDQLFDTKDFKYFSLALHTHECYRLYESYRNALTAAGVMPTVRILIYIKGQRDPYEIIRSYSAESMATAYMLPVVEEIPADRGGLVEKIEIYPIFKYFPEGTTGSIEGHPYSIPDFYSTFASSIRTIGFFSSLADANAASTAYSSKTLNRENAYNWISFDNSGLSLKDGDFAIAAITNTSKIAANAALMNGLTQWIADNAEKENIRFAVHLGGVMDNTTAYWKTGADYATITGISALNSTSFNYNTPLLYLLSAGKINANGAKDTKMSNQAINVKNAFDTLKNANIPHGIITQIMDNLSAQTRSSVLYEYISSDTFGYTGRFEGKGYLSTINKAEMKANQVMPVLIENGAITVDENGDSDVFRDLYSFENIYYTFREGGIDYLVLVLEVWPRTAVREWANDVLAQNKDKRVILFTASMLDKKGEIINCWDTVNGSISNKITLNGKPHNAFLDYGTIFWNDGPVDGTELWRRLLQKHENLFMIVEGGSLETAGENPGNGVQMNTIKGVHGNDVTIVQARFDGILGNKDSAILLMRFREKGRKLDILPYVPSLNSYSSYHSITIDLDVYNITIDPSVTGVTCKETALPGETVYLTITPESGKKAKAGSVVIEYTTSGEYYTDQASMYDRELDIYYDLAHVRNHTRKYEKIVVNSANGVYSFVMPNADVTIKSISYIPQTEPNISLIGASVRLSGNLGMRFLASFYLDGVDTTYKAQWIYGILVVPKAIADSGVELRFNQFGGIDLSVLDIPMLNYYQYNVNNETGKGYFRYTGVIQQIPVYAYDTEVVAVAYCRYTTDGSTFRYAYSNELTRSFRSIVTEAYMSGRESLTNEVTLNNLRLK